jgi:hypothetical protein
MGVFVTIIDNNNNNRSQTVLSPYDIMNHRTIYLILLSYQQIFEQLKL